MSVPLLLLLLLWRQPLGIRESDTGLAPPSQWDLVADKMMLSYSQPLQIARCTKIINPGTEEAKYIIDVKQLAKFVVVSQSLTPKITWHVSLPLPMTYSIFQMLRLWLFCQNTLLTTTTIHIWLSVPRDRRTCCDLIVRDSVVKSRPLILKRGWGLGQCNVYLSTLTLPPYHYSSHRTYLVCLSQLALQRVIVLFLCWHFSFFDSPHLSKIRQYFLENKCSNDFSLRKLLF